MRLWFVPHQLLCLSFPIVHISRHPGPLLRRGCGVWVGGLAPQIRGDHPCELFPGLRT